LARFIKILAASVGGGLVLGAGIRLGEAIANWEPAADSDPAARLTERLAALEGRLQHLETVPAPGQTGPERETSSSAHQQDGMTPVETRHAGLQDWIQESIGTRMGELEIRLRAESERDRQEMLDTVVQTVQTRVIHRITKLEDEVAGQSETMNELRECSLRTERSVQKLLGGLDKLIAGPEPGTGDHAAESRPRSGWRMFSRGRRGPDSAKS
jgi:uncharacterized coiled-coil protein SlyX